MKAANRIKSFLVGDNNNFEKYQQVEMLLPKGKRLVAPFIGGGGIFLNTNYQSYLLADSNQELINVFEMLVEYKQAFIDRAIQYFLPITNTKEVYGLYQHAFEKLSPNKAIIENRIRRGCLYLYLNHHGAREECLCHGIAGVNVPYGNHSEVCFPEQEMKNFLAKVARCEVAFLAADFNRTLAITRVGDVVFCDVPNISVDKEIYFGSYSEKFSWGDHFRLFSSFHDLGLRGIPVVFSGSNLNNKVLAEKIITIE